MPKYRPTWIVPTALYCAVIFFLSSQPDLGENPPAWLDWPGSDKLVHLVLFGGLAGLVAMGLIRSNGSTLSRRALFFGPMLFATLYGLSDEIHQWFVPKRSCDLGDLFADALGATIIAGAITGWAARASYATARRP
jgi:VanZ family protein